MIAVVGDDERLSVFEELYISVQKENFMIYFV